MRDKMSPLLLSIDSFKFQSPFYLPSKVWKARGLAVMRERWRKTINDIFSLFAASSRPAMKSLAEKRVISQDGGHSLLG